MAWHKADSRSPFFPYPNFSSPHQRSFLIHKRSNAMTPPLIEFSKRKVIHSLILFLSGWTLQGLCLHQQHDVTVFCDSDGWLESRGEPRLAVLPFRYVKSFHSQVKWEEDYNTASACWHFFQFKDTWIYMHICWLFNLNVVNRQTLFSSLLRSTEETC